jgi:hypothetical protein
MLAVDCAVTLQRLSCFFGREVSSRYAHILGLTANPNGPWTVQRPLGHLAGSADHCVESHHVRVSPGLMVEKPENSDDARVPALTNTPGSTTRR